MKISVDVDVDGKTIFVETFYDLPNVIPDRPVAIAREVEQLMVAYPAYKTITVQIEKDDDGTQDIHEPTTSQR
jgi:hypothetical protein